ncbi:hypothetical protein LTR28_012017, partial [Elasticomyces elasticus]
MSLSPIPTPSPMGSDVTSSISSLRPDATLFSEIERLKDLVSLSSAGTTEGIGHSIFRSAAGIRVSQARILRELDALKERYGDTERTRRDSDTSSVGLEGWGDKDQVIVDLREELEALRRTKSEEVDHVEARVIELEDEKQDLSRAMREVEAQLQDALKKAKDAGIMRQRVQELEASASRTEAELEQLQDEYRKSNELLERMRKQHDTENAASAKEVARLQSINSEAAAAAAKTTAETAATRHQLAEASLRADQATEDLDRFKAEIQLLNALSAETTGKLVELDDQVKALKHEKSEVLDRSAFLAQDLEKTKSLLQQARGEVYSAEQQVRNAKNEATEAEQSHLKRIAEMEAEVRNAKSDMHASLAEKDNRISGLVDKAKNIEQVHQRRMAELRAEIQAAEDHAQIELAEKENRIRGLEDLAKTVEENHDRHVVELEKQHASVLAEAEKAKSTAQEEAEQIKQSLNSRLESAQEELETAKRHHVEIEGAIKIKLAETA